ncbi:MAG: hypothetical protein OEN23_18195, partial [Paracoccaceae bacterium]|nr:hypothetical protein [Paracoccaceae bacterium]
SVRNGPLDRDRPRSGLCLRTADIDPSNDFALAAKISFEPNLPDAALHSNGGFWAVTGRPVSVRYAYS